MSIHTLIHSLTPSERRYFTRHAQQHAISGKNVYLSLFEAVAGQEEYDEESLKNKFVGADFVALKNYLLKMVLKAMRGFHAGKTIDHQLRELLSDIDFLEGKRLYLPCFKLIQKGMKLALLHDRFQAQLAFLAVERRLVKFLPQIQLQDELESIKNRRVECIRRMDLELSYIELYDWLFGIVRTQLRSNKEATLALIHGTLQDPLLTQEGLPASFQARSYQYLCAALCHQMLGQFAQAQAMHVQNVALWEEYPHWMMQEPLQHQRALANYLSACQINDDWTPFAELLPKLAENTGGAIEERAEHFAAFQNLQLAYLMNTGKLSEAGVQAKSLESGLHTFGDKIPESRRISFIYNMVVVFFFLERHRDAIHWLNKLLHLPRTEARMDLQRAARLFWIICHHELGNLDLMEHLFGSSTRFLQSHGINEFEETLLPFLKSLFMRPPAQGWPREKAQELHDKFEVLSASKGDASYPGIRECILWLRAKQTGKALLVVLNG